VTTFVYLVQAADPGLRDREVQRLVDELLDGQDRTLALEDHTIPARRKAGEETVDGGEETPVFASVTNALQSPPFMTAFRVVVVREVGNLTTEEAQWLAGWAAEPLDTARLVLVAGGGRTPAALDKAVKAHGDVAGPVTEKTADLLAAELRGAGLRLAPAAAKRVSEHLGDDAGRVPELVALLESTFGAGAQLDEPDVAPYLGESGTAGRFDLTNAIDRGDGPAALEVLHRLLAATSAQQPRPVHPMQIMATLSFHYQRLVRLDDPTIRTKEQAAEVLGMRSAGGARFPLDASRRLGTDGLREAMRLLARAELDLRGEAGLDERTVIEVLVARLAALSRRYSPAARR